MNQIFSLRSPIPSPPSSLLPNRVRLLKDDQVDLLRLLESMPVEVRRRVVVLTMNPSPEFAQDVWELGPAVLLIGPHTDEDLTQALEDAERGMRYREPSPLESSLIPSERAILRFLPSGECNKRIAKQLGLSDRTVRNRLVDIAEKLGLENRTQIAMYYAGQWQWLTAYRGVLERFSARGAMMAPILNAAD